MEAEVAVGVVGAALAVVGIVVALLQLRRTPRARHSSPSLGAAVTRVPDPPGQLVIGEVPRQPLSHTRRDELLAKVVHALANGRVCAVMGGRGVGKSHLAATYVRDRLADGLARVLWTVADDTAAVVTALADFAQQAGVVDDVGDTMPAARAALRWLEQQPEPSLIVLDNALEPDAIGPWLPRRGNVQVIITTTNQEFAVVVTPVHVDVFTPDQAVTFLCARAGRDDPANAALVASELGQLPLALAQAGAVIRKGRMSFSDYLLRFRSMPLRSLQRVPGDDYPHSLEEATLLSINTVEEGDLSGIARRILDLMAVLSEAGVRRDLLYSLWREPDVDDAVGALADTSVVGFDVNATTVTVHRLTRKVALARVRRDGRILDAATDAVALLTRAADSMPARGIGVVDHIDEVWAEVKDDPAVSATCPLLAELLRLRRWSVERLTAMGEFNRAVASGLAVLAEHRYRLPADHESIVTARSLLISAYITADREDDAIPFAEQALTDRLRLAGPDDPSTVHARNTLGYCCECAGRLNRALEIHQFNLEESLRVCGPDASSTFKARINLASTYRSMGQLAKAVPLFEENLQENIRVYGRLHRSTVNARGELARIFARIGRADEAIRLHDSNVAAWAEQKYEDVYATWWPQYRAAAYSAGGRHVEAIGQLRALTQDAEELLPRDNPQAIRLRLFLARALLVAGRTSEALALFERTVADRERVLGVDHPASLNARRNLGLALATCGRRRRARNILNAAVRDYVRVLGTEHPYSRTAKSNLDSLSTVRKFPT